MKVVTAILLAPFVFIGMICRAILAVIGSLTWLLVLLFILGFVIMIVKEVFA